MSKGKKILNYSLIAVLGLGSLTLSSCNKHKEPTLQAFQDVNLHLAKFSLSKQIEETDKDGKKILKQDKNIATTFFSIENVKGEGVLTNLKPLPYGTELKKIGLDIVPMMSNAKVEVSLDGGSTFKEWKKSDKQTFDLMPANDKLKIRLSSPFPRQGADTYAYTYKVRIQVYKFDPQTIHWSELSTPAIDVLGSHKFATYTLGNGQMTLMTIDEVNKTNKFYSLNVGAKALDEIVYPALPNASYIKEIKNYKNHLFALSSDGKLYQANEDKTWQALDLEAENLLGVFAPRKKGGKPSLALVLKDGGSFCFAFYDVATKQLVKGSQLPQSFPIGAYKTLSTYATEVGAKLTLLGANGLTYISTNGTAWAKSIAGHKENVQMTSSFAFVQNDDLFYQFISDSKGLALYTKGENQASWDKNGDVAFKSVEGQNFDVASFANRSIALWVDGQTFYLYKGGANAMLYKGELKKNAI